MAYGQSANWGGQAEQETEIFWEVEFYSSPPKPFGVTFTIPAGTTGPQMATALASAWNLKHETVHRATPDGASVHFDGNVACMRFHATTVVPENGSSIAAGNGMHVFNSHTGGGNTS
jgi:hypothetical protein